MGGNNTLSGGLWQLRLAARRRDIICRRHEKVCVGTMLHCSAESRAGRRRFVVAGCAAAEYSEKLGSPPHRRVLRIVLESFGIT